MALPLRFVPPHGVFQIQPNDTKVIVERSGIDLFVVLCTIVVPKHAEEIQDSCGTVKKRRSTVQEIDHLTTLHRANRVGNER